MVHNRDIVVIGIQPWDITIGSNCKNIAEEFSANNRVLYINPPTTRGELFLKTKNVALKKRKQIIKGKEPLVEKINSNLYVVFPSCVVESINWLQIACVHDWLNLINAKRFARQIKQKIDEFHFRNFILFNDSMMFMGVHMKRLLNPAVYVYYMRDNLVINPFWKRHGVRLEAALLKEADLVVNNSVMYAEYGARYNSHSYMVGQGCDTSAYIDHGQIAVPDDLLAISGIKIGYVGFLTSRRLDIDLIEAIALARSDWQIVLVGPEDEVFKQSKLHSLTNVHFLGSRPVETVPGYIKGFDVTMNPQVITPVTMGNYPRKVDEYLAMGKPVVCSATKAMEYFADSVYVATTPDEYIVMIDKALKEDTPDMQAQRAAVGQSHSWTNSVNLIYHYIELVENKKS